MLATSSYGNGLILVRRTLEVYDLILSAGSKCSWMVKTPNLGARKVMQRGDIVEHPFE